MIVKRTETETKQSAVVLFLIFSLIYRDVPLIHSTLCFQTAQYSYSGFGSHILLTKIQSALCHRHVALTADSCSGCRQTPRSAKLQ